MRGPGPCARGRGVGDAYGARALSRSACAALQKTGLAERRSHLPDVDRAASRNTHAKIAVVAVVGAIIVAVVGMTARVNDVTVANEGSRVEAEGTVIPAGGPSTVTSNSQNTIR